MADKVKPGQHILRPHKPEVVFDGNDLPVALMMSPARDGEWLRRKDMASWVKQELKNYPKHLPRGRLTHLLDCLE